MNHSNCLCRVLNLEEAVNNKCDNPLRELPLWFVDLFATVKNLQVTPLIFTKNSLISGM